MMTLEELEAVWASLQPPSSADAISGRRASGLPPERPAYLALDGRARRHFIIEAPDDTRPVTTRQTRGLEVTTGRFRVGSNPEALYIDLACTDGAQNSTFSAVVEDLLRSLRVPQGSLRDVVVGTLARWRAFWSAKPGTMTREEALGLFGELWFLRRWLAPVTMATIERWQVTQDARHDFQGQAASVEVKTAATATRSGPIHHIASLDQLADAEQGQLYLFSLQACDDALASDNLRTVVEGLTTELRNSPGALTLFNEKLASRGYTPADTQTSLRPLRILAERLYLVTEGFPRILRASFIAGLPQGVLDITYAIDLAGCQAWLVAESPTDPSVRSLFPSAF
jgi:hypothetical protein